MTYDPVYIHEKYTNSKYFSHLSNDIIGALNACKITSFPPTLYSNQVDLCFKNITSVDTGSD